MINKIVAIDTEKQTDYLINPKIPVLAHFGDMTDDLSQTAKFHEANDGGIFKIEEKTGTTNFASIQSLLAEMIKAADLTGPVKVMVVDDDFQLQLLFKSFLEDLRIGDCQIGQIEAYDGSISATKALRTSGFRPDLIILDCNMAEGYGYDFLRNIRQGKI